MNIQSPVARDKRIGRFALISVQYILGIDALLSGWRDRRLLDAHAAWSTNSSDQGGRDGYLSLAHYVGQFKFPEKCPLYEVFIECCRVIFGPGARSTAIAVHLDAVILSAVAIGVAVRALVTRIGLRNLATTCGLFATMWILNLKYMLVNPDGPGVFAAVFVAGALWAISTQRCWSRSVAALMLFLGSQCRAEVAVPMLVFLLWMFVARHEESERYPEGKLRRWRLSCLGSAAAIFAMIRLRPATPYGIGDLNVAFAQNFAVTYVRRNRLYHRFPNSIVWRQYQQVLDYVVHGDHTIISITLHYPGQVVLNVLYNIGLLAVAEPASVLAMSSYVLAGVGTLAFLVAAVVSLRPGAPDRPRISGLRDPAALGMSALWILPIVVLNVTNVRYLFSVVPLGFAGLLIGGLVIVEKIFRSGSVAQSDMPGELGQLAYEIHVESETTQIRK